MSKCADYLELISAYADGELAEPDRRRVDKHLEACDQCSAILDIYREISIAVGESCVPAPEALRDGVMKRVLSGDMAEKGAAREKPRLVRAALTRYLPLAACLAVVLLSLPWVVNYFRGPSHDAASAPEQAALLYASPASPEAPPESMPTTAGGGPNTFNDALTAPGSDAPMPDAVDGAMARSARGAADADADADSAEAFDAGAFDAEVSDTEPFGAEPEWDKMAVDSQMGDVPMEAPESSGASLFDDFTALRSTGENGDPAAPSDVWGSLGGFEDAYAWIELTGGLPELLRGQEPKRLPAGSGFEECYVIPRTVLAELIEEAGASGEIDLEAFPIDVDGDYAVVLWKPH